MLDLSTKKEKDDVKNEKKQCTGGDDDGIVISTKNSELATNTAVNAPNISTTLSIDESKGDKLDTSSEKYTLRYLRLNGYTPDRIREEILGLGSDSTYE